MAITEQKKNKQDTGGRLFHTSPKNDVQSDPFFRFCTFYKDRSGASSWFNTHDAGDIGPGITSHWRPAGNGSGWSWSGTGECTNHHKNSLIHMVDGGNFQGGNGCLAASYNGATTNRGGENKLLASLAGGGAPQRKGSLLCRGTDTAGADTAGCKVIPGDHGRLFTGVYAVMANVMNIRGFNSFNIGSVAEGGSIGANKNLALTSAIGAINSKSKLGTAICAGTIMSLESKALTSIYTLGGGGIILSNGPGGANGGLAVAPKGTILNGPFVYINTFPTPPPVVVDVAGIGPPNVPPAPSRPVAPAQFA